MKLAVAESTLQSRRQATGEFKVNASGKAFKILSSGIYQDKILAVVRELSCNALDSHIAAGKPNEPFIVHLPNKTEPWFSVEDFGVGLSDHDIHNLYTTYFESTKSESNDFIGALGLGSKSPFSYTDTFNVTSTFKGVRTIYSLVVESDGTPQIFTLSSTKMPNQPNGIKVQVPVSPDNSWDIRKFEESAVNVYRYFNVKPVIVGVTDAQVKIINTPKEYIFKNELYAVVQKSQNGQRWYNSYAIQGVVAYKIDTDKLQLSDAQETFMRRRTVDIFFPMGSVSFTAGRETLEYDEFTRKSCAEYIQKVMDRFEDDCAEFLLTNAKTYFDFCVLAQKYGTDISLEKVENVTINGVSYPKINIMKADLDDKFKSITLRTRSRRAKTIVKDEYEQMIEIFNVPYFVNDMGRSGIPSVRLWMKQNNIEQAIIIDKADQDIKLSAGGAHSYTTKVPNKSKLSISFFQKIYDFVPGITLQTISTLDVVREKINRTKGGYDLHLYRYTNITLNRRSSSYSEKHADKFSKVMKKDLPAGVKFFWHNELLQHNNYNPNRDFGKIRSLMEIIDGLTKVHNNVYILNKSEYNKIKNDKDWVYIIPFIENVMKTKVSRAKKIHHARAIKELKDSLPINFNHLVHFAEFGDIKSLVEGINNHITLEDIPSDAGIRLGWSFIPADDLTKIQESTDKKIKDLVELSDNVKTKYPLLSLLPTYGNIDKIVQELKIYLTAKA